MSVLRLTNCDYLIIVIVNDAALEPHFPVSITSVTATPLIFAIHEVPKICSRSFCVTYTSM